MEKFTTFTGLVAPIDRANIDTDQIIPKQFLQKTTRTGFAQHLFHDWRYLDAQGNIPNPEFILNQSPYDKAQVLLSRENFGCGSSREHAPWSIQEFGFKVVIASSFADIFYANCINIGVVPVKLSESEVDWLFKQSEQSDLQIKVSLDEMSIEVNGKSFSFKLDKFHRYCLQEGIDAVGWTLKQQDKINTYENSIPAWR